MMKSQTSDITRYEGLKRGRGTLRAVARLTMLACVMVGVSIFLDQASALLSDAQFTWGERRVMGLVGLVSLGGAFATGWAISRVILVFADVLDAFADAASAASRSAELIETELAPTLKRIALALEKEPRGNLAERRTTHETRPRSG